MATNYPPLIKGDQVRCNGELHVVDSTWGPEQSQLVRLKAGYVVPRSWCEKVSSRHPEPSIPGTPRWFGWQGRPWVLNDSGSWRKWNSQGGVWMYQTWDNLIRQFGEPHNRPPMEGLRHTD